nr:MAG TPA_asm: hypothetical protein [Caudoviricetes sp.]
MHMFTINKKAKMQIGLKRNVKEEEKNTLDLIIRKSIKISLLFHFCLAVTEI